METSITDVKQDLGSGAKDEVENVETDMKIPSADKIKQRNVGLYLEALERYPNDESIDQEEEKRLKRKIDRRILPVLGLCYFFYVSE